MPEAYEIARMVDSINERLTGLTIREVKLGGNPYKKKKKQAQWEKKISSIPVPFKIKNLVSRGKEICLMTSKMSFRITLGTGAFLYFLTPEEDMYLEMEPFFSDSFVVMSGDEGTFCIVDCHTSRHQASFETFSGSTPKWRPKVGPCVLKENDLFRKHLKKQMTDNPKYFATHSIAALLHDERYCNGFGEYSVSEILHRLYMSKKIVPWDEASILRNDEIFKLFVDMPLRIYEEQKLYSKDYNPASFGPKQKAQWKEFRYHFLQVYRKRLWKKQPVIPLVIMIPSENPRTPIIVPGQPPPPPPLGKRKTIYTTVLKPSDIPSIAVAKSTREIPLEAKLKIVPKTFDETWFRFPGSFLTERKIGVGLHDFVSPTEENEEAMKLYGIPANQEEPGPETTPKTTGKKRKKPRSSKKINRKLKKILAEGGTLWEKKVVVMTESEATLKRKLSSMKKQVIPDS